MANVVVQELTNSVNFMKLKRINLLRDSAPPGQYRQGSNRDNR